MMMKIQCNACEAAEVNVLCCAEEAALCWACDHKIHATSKLASEHHRLPLSSSSPFPNCDICQVSVGYFFCAQDRALLCRKCDVAIHTANAFVSSHERFLLTGVKVGLLQSTLPGSLPENLNRPAQKSSEQGPSRAGGVRSKAAFAGQMGGDGAAATSKSNSI
ncbi:hypothetical protein TIFTF001_050968 [Ficus carica]|uniref:B box-type domain-containing protein n=1 Tax=Ficus carica TaxID=3494 RepID=A0AA87Z0X2_FICCA|nr:hypothetical protein TIFTF001_050968 [Ficus carica]